MVAAAKEFEGHVLPKLGYNEGYVADAIDTEWESAWDAKDGRYRPAKYGEYKTVEQSMEAMRGYARTAMVEGVDFYARVMAADGNVVGWEDMKRDFDKEKFCSVMGT